MVRFSLRRFSACASRRAQRNRPSPVRNQTSSTASCCASCRRRWILEKEVQLLDPADARRLSRLPADRTSNGQVWPLLGSPSAFRAPRRSAAGLCVLAPMRRWCDNLMWTGEVTATGTPLALTEEGWYRTGPDRRHPACDRKGIAPWQRHSANRAGAPFGWLPDPPGARCPKPTGSRSKILTQVR